MSEIDKIKSQLIADLWLPVAKKGGTHFFPRRKTNYDMSLFTLTADSNFEEILCFKKKKLISEKKTIAWSYASQKRVRLETEFNEAIIAGFAKYETSISFDDFEIKNSFPFHIINLDFSSQDPIFESGRLEKELISLEKTISLQKDNSAEFVLIFTTILNGNHLNFSTLCTNSDQMHVSGWRSLQDETFSLHSPIQDNPQKIVSIEYFIRQMAKKYQYSIEYLGKSIVLRDGKIAFSAAGLLRRNSL